MRKKCLNHTEPVPNGSFSFNFATDQTFACVYSEQSEASHVFPAVLSFGAGSVRESCLAILLFWED